MPGDSQSDSTTKPLRLVLASSNPGKLREYRELADSRIEIELMPDFDRLAPFDESAPTFAENSAGKALYYSRHTPEIVLADDSGLVVPALGGAPGVHSARYAGPKATDAERYTKLLNEMAEMEGDLRRAYFVCVTSIAKGRRVLAIASDRADGFIAHEPRGSGGFGYDPVFLFPQFEKTYAELTRLEKNQYSHRGKAFRKIADILERISSRIKSGNSF